MLSRSVSLIHSPATICRVARNCVGFADQRRKEQVGEDGRGRPGHDDDPAEADGEPPGGREEPRHNETPRLSGGTQVVPVGDGDAGTAGTFPARSGVELKPTTSWPRNASRNG